MTASVFITHNFVINLEAIEYFLKDNDSLIPYNTLVKHLESVVSNLELFPEMGVSFFNRQTYSPIGKIKKTTIENLSDKFIIKELIIDDYIILYAMSKDKKKVYLLSIKHHHQLSYDFKDLWIK